MLCNIYFVKCDTRRRGQWSFDHPVSLVCLSFSVVVDEQIMCADHQKWLLRNVRYYRQFILNTIILRA